MKVVRYDDEQWYIVANNKNVGKIQKVRLMSGGYKVLYALGKNSEGKEIQVRVSRPNNQAEALKDLEKYLNTQRELISRLSKDIENLRISLKHSQFKITDEVISEAIDKKSKELNELLSFQVEEEVIND